MPKKLSTHLFILLLILLSIITQQEKLNSQLISYDNNYASLELHNAIYDLIKNNKMQKLNY